MRFLANKEIIKKIKLFPKIVNMVVVADFEHKIIFEQLAEHEQVIYEPEQFPGAILEIEEPHKASVLIFATEKAVFAGLARTKAVVRFLKRLVIILYMQPRVVALLVPDELETSTSQENPAGPLCPL